MAEQIALNFVYQARVLCYDATTKQIGENIRHYECIAKAGNPVTDADAAADFAAQLSTLYQILMAEDVSFVGVGVTRVSGIAPFPEEAFNGAFAGAGGVTGHTSPGQNSYLIQLRTGYAGRRYRGRVYPPFIPMGNLDENNLITAGAIADLADLAGWLDDDQVVPNPGLDGTATMRPVIWHRDTHTSTRILTAVAMTGVATQRRRSEYGRQNPLPPFA